MDKYKGHTPGPWVTSKSIIHTANDGENQICQVSGFPCGWTLDEMVDRGAERDKTSIANAKLIADAPMLAEQNAKVLAELKYMLAHAHILEGDEICKCPLCKIGRRIRPIIAEIEEG